MSQPLIKGSYVFHRQEMVAGFDFQAGNTFNFFYSYGAVDRTATGSFIVAGDSILLKSDKEAGKDFKIMSQTKSGKGYSIQFTGANPYLLNHIRCTFFVDHQRHDAFTDSHGEVKVTYPDCDQICVFHTLYPDMVTFIKEQGNNNNRFVLALNPSLEQVSFKGIVLKIENDSTLSCIPNYLMMLEDIQFIKK